MINLNDHTLMCFTVPCVNLRVSVNVFGATGRSPRSSVHRGNVAKVPAPYAYDRVG